MKTRLEELSEELNVNIKCLEQLDSLVEDKEKRIQLKNDFEKRCEEIKKEILELLGLNK